MALDKAFEMCQPSTVAHGVVAERDFVSLRLCLTGCWRSVLTCSRRSLVFCDFCRRYIMGDYPFCTFDRTETSCGMGGELSFDIEFRISCTSTVVHGVVVGRMIPRMVVCCAGTASPGSNG